MKKEGHAASDEPPMRTADRVIQLFHEARQRPAGPERECYLAAACAADVEMKVEILSLLQAEADEGDSGFLQLPRERGVEIAARAGDRIGPYRLIEPLGEGGWGVVFMAEQEEPVRRRVALKIIRPGMDSRQVIGRFEAERQTLALMDHPNIAKFLDAGVTDDVAQSPRLPPGLPNCGGRPYFVMELVQGLRITDYCARRNLSVRQRLDLFIAVCEAVQHAHQKGIIHRDLKPSNILVAANDGRPVPKVIDFGIAKAVGRSPTDKTAFTQWMAFLGTPAYMSPEQAAMTSPDIDTRSDIYSLGVLLYEMLTGTTPFDAHELLTAGFDGMRRIIRETEPERPSTRLTRVAGSVPTRIPAAHVLPGSGCDATNGALPIPHTPVKDLLNQVRGDVDWIVMKCLEKDRTRRYGTASALAADVGRHLNGEPIVARPSSAAYRIGKAIRRNRGIFAAAALVVLVLVAGIAATSWQAIRARRAEKEQGSQRALAQRRLAATLRFIEEVFRNVSPRLQNLVGGSHANRSLNDAGMALMKDLASESEDSADFRRVLGQLHIQAGFSQGWFAGSTTADYDASLRSVREAVTLLSVAEPGMPDVHAQEYLARAEMVAGYAALRLMRFEEALAHFRRFDHWGQSLARSTNQYFSAEGRKLVRWAFGSTGLVLLHNGRAGEALSNYFQPILADLQARGVPDQPGVPDELHDLQQVHASLGLAYQKLQRSREALPHLREGERLAAVLAERRPNHGDALIDAVDACARLGGLLVQLGQPDEGSRILDRSLKQAEDLNARDPANVSFQELRITVLCLNAVSLASRPRDGIEPDGYRRRLDTARGHLDRAQRLIAALPTESARIWPRQELKMARDVADNAGR